MKNFKTILFILLSVLLLFLMTSCGNNGKKDNDDSTESGSNKTKYTVRFNLNHPDALGKPSNQSVNNGGKAQEPDAPTLSGHDFLGWCLNQTCTEEYDFDEPVTKDLILYACWENEADEQEIPDGLTYSDAVKRVSAYIEQMITIVSKGELAYNDKNDVWLGIGPSSITLSFFSHLVTLTITNNFGTSEFDLPSIEMVLGMLGYENIEFEENNGQFILEYDINRNGLQHRALVITYNKETDSGQIIEFKDYNSSAESIESLFEFIKTCEGYAIQIENGQMRLKIENNKVVAITASIYKDEAEERPSIYDNLDHVDDEFALKGMEYTIIFDGINFEFIKKEQYYDYKVAKYTKFRFIRIKYGMDGTEISKVEDDWQPIE